ncbi:MAG: hypothetical protein FJ291_02625 [Planctomycetes bacterium]|nr:hypothetical protein [Planctomycetota bacterium]
MGMGFGMMELLMLVLSGGGWGNDLLDYLPSDAYWKAKGVPMSVERMVAELNVGEPADLAQLIRDLGAEKHETREAATAKLRALGPAAIPSLKKAADSDDPEVRTRARELLATLSGGAQAGAVRRLMAIRALGELRKPEAAGPLRPLLESKEPFVADYAARAIAAIEGKPHERPQATAEQIRSDLCLLPPNCGIVAQLRLPGGRASSFAEALKSIGPALGPGQDLARALDELTKGICAVAERVGNIRLDAVTLGVADEVGDRKGFAVVVARGRYDAQAVKAAFGQFQLDSTKVEGLDVFSVEREMRLIPCSDERLVFVGGPRNEQLPIKEIAAAVQANSDKPALGPKMLELIKAIDAPAWAAVVMSDAYRQAPFLAPFETVVATGKTADDAMALSVVAVGKDPEALKQSVAEVQKGVKEATADVAREVARMPFLKPIVEFMESIRVEAAGAEARLTARMKGQGGALMLPVLMLFTVRAASAPRQMPAVDEGRAVPAPAPVPDRK